jgi:hypothetical protein
MADKAGGQTAAYPVSWRIAAERWIPRREFASCKELHDYAKRTGKVSLLKGVHKRQQRLSPDQYEIVDVRTARGLAECNVDPEGGPKNPGGG